MMHDAFLYLCPSKNKKIAKHVLFLISLHWQRLVKDKRKRQSENIFEARWYSSPIPLEDIKERLEKPRRNSLESVLLFLEL